MIWSLSFCCSGSRRRSSTPPMAATIPSSAGAGAVLRLAILSRLLLLTLISLSRLLFDPYDSSAVLNPSCLAAGEMPRDPVLFPRLAAAIERSVVWDSVYFVRIAECGYEHEQSFAFLPLLPAAMALFSRSVLAPLVALFGYRAVLALSGYMINNVAFVFAAMYFHRLSVLILKDLKAARLASALFCFNPASIFYSSIYSESLYALFSLGGIFHIFTGANIMAMLLLAVSGSARSNGALNAGYFMFLALIQTYEAILQKQKAKAMKAIVAGIMCSVCIFIPYVAFQVYGYFNICTGGASDELRPWCKARIPHLYAFLQSHYWGVGFLRYFQMKQLPNFLLASPILTLAISSIVKYAISLPQMVQLWNMYGGEVLSPALYLQEKSPVSDAIYTTDDQFSFKSPKGVPVVNRRRKDSNKVTTGSSTGHKPIYEETLPLTKQGYHCILVLPFVLHMVFLTFTALFIMHVQVATRFLSCCPSIYWFASYTMLSSDISSRKLGYLITFYFIAYILLGTLLFSNFYPFT